MSNEWGLVNSLPKYTFYIGKSDRYHCVQSARRKKAQKNCISNVSGSKYSIIKTKIDATCTQTTNPTSKHTQQQQKKDFDTF